MLPLAALTLLLVSSSILSARTLIVAQDGSGEFTEIWSAIESAEDGDTIFVAPGWYEGGLPIRKSVYLKGAGADKTVIASGLGNLSVSANNVVIEGFDIRANGEGRTIERLSSIACENTSPIIRRNILQGSITGILVIGNSKPIINYNSIKSSVGIRLENNPNPIDARFNWWDTTDMIEIQGRIFDGDDREGLGIVEFDPWLTTPEETRTSVMPTRWSQIKRLFQLVR